MSRYYILHAPMAGVGVYDSIEKAQTALEIKNIPDMAAWIESAPANELVSQFNVKRELYSLDGAWIQFEDPVIAEYTID